MLSTVRHSVIKCLALAGLTMFATGREARAGFSQVNAPSSADEMNHAQILSHAYGGTFTANGVDFSNGSMTAQRLDDALGNDMDFKTGVGSDQCWTNGIISARAIARFAGYQQTLGIVDGDIGGSFHSLFTVSGTGVNVSGSVSNVDMSGKDFRFARGGGGDMFTSLNLDNGAFDQMVSYKLTGPGGSEKYLLFFEDAGSAQNSDWDYNDLVVEISSNSPAVVPLPPAALSGLTVLLAGVAWKSRSRFKAFFT